MTVLPFRQSSAMADEERQTGRDLGDDNSLSGRAALRWLPSDNVSIDFNVDATRRREDGAASLPWRQMVCLLQALQNNVVFLGHLGCAPPPGPNRQ